MVAGGRATRTGQEGCLSNQVTNCIKNQSITLNCSFENLKFQ